LQDFEPIGDREQLKGAAIALGKTVSKAGLATSRE
jgi:hypothetical protein